MCRVVGILYSIIRGLEQSKSKDQWPRDGDWPYKNIVILYMKVIPKLKSLYPDGLTREWGYLRKKHFKG